jgi:hypothetical protein
MKSLPARSLQQPTAVPRCTARPGFGVKNISELRNIALNGIIFPQRPNRLKAGARQQAAACRKGTRRERRRRTTKGISRAKKKTTSSDRLYSGAGLTCKTDPLLDNHRMVRDSFAAKLASSVMEESRWLIQTNDCS